MHHFHFYKGIHYIFRKRCRREKQKHNEGKKKLFQKEKSVRDYITVLLLTLNCKLPIAAFHYLKIRP